MLEMEKELPRALRAKTAAVSRPITTPVKQPIQTPVKRRKDSLSSSDSDKKQDIDGDSYIKQYYMRKYGSAKKGFNPKTELLKRRAESSKPVPETRTPL